MKRLLTLLFALLMTLGCLFGCASSGNGDEGRAAVADYTYNIDVKPYAEAIESERLTLVNKTQTVDKSYAPESTVKLDPSLTLYGKEVELEPTAAKAAEALLRELWAMGWTDIVITSGYRTYEYQSILFNTYLGNEQEKHPGWSIKQCEDEVKTYSAVPGTSEHQTGLCVDLIVSTDPKLDESFAQHPAYGWLQENAFKFGFILRFPKGKENVTGYSYEPWHYRFVGIDAAKSMHDSGLVLEEYLTK